MHNGADIIYSFDGTFDGLMCCVFECFSEKEMPCDIYSPEYQQLSFTKIKEIITENDKTLRVKNSLKNKLTSRSYYDLQVCFLSCDDGKNMMILKFIIMAMKYGKTVSTMLSDDIVNKFTKTAKNVSGEAHYYKEFLRFSSYNNALVAVIEPKNIVLPLIKYHYTDRLNTETFMIYDKTHGMALTYSKRHCEIIPVEYLELPPVDEEEQKYRDLWKKFYATIGIKERYNEKCRMNRMPKRYWNQLTELSELLKPKEDI